MSIVNSKRQQSRHQTLQTDTNDSAMTKKNNSTTKTSTHTKFKLQSMHFQSYFKRQQHARTLIWCYSGFERNKQ